MTAVSPECGWAGTCTGDPIPGSSWCHRHTMVDRFSAHLNPPPPTVAEVEAALVHRFHGDTAPDDGGCWHCREAAETVATLRWKVDCEPVSPRLAATDGPDLIVHPVAASMPDRLNAVNEAGRPEPRLVSFPQVRRHAAPPNAPTALPPVLSAPYCPLRRCGVTATERTPYVEALEARFVENATLLTAIYRDMGGVTLVVRESDKAAARGALVEFRRTHGGAA